MSRFLSAVRGNAHVLNYVLLATGVGLPMALYVNMRSPTQDQVERELFENYGSNLAKERENQVKINQFWKQKDARSMDEVYTQLLRSGRGNVKRHHELSGALAETTAAQDPNYARIQSILALPQAMASAEGAGDVTSSAAGEAAKTEQAAVPGKT